MLLRFGDLNHNIFMTERILSSHHVICSVWWRCCFGKGCLHYLRGSSVLKYGRETNLLVFEFFKELLVEAGFWEGGHWFLSNKFKILQLGSIKSNLSFVIWWWLTLWGLLIIKDQLVNIYVIQVFYLRFDRGIDIGAAALDVKDAWLLAVILRENPLRMLPEVVGYAPLRKLLIWWLLYSNIFSLLLMTSRGRRAALLLILMRAIRLDGPLWSIVLSLSDLLHLHDWTLSSIHLGLFQNHLLSHILAETLGYTSSFHTYRVQLYH